MVILCYWLLTRFYNAAKVVKYLSTTKKTGLIRFLINRQSHISYISFSNSSSSMPKKRLPFGFSVGFHLPIATSISNPSDDAFHENKQHESHYKEAYYVG